MPDPTPPLAAGLSGRYRLERELGAGGMATVYLALESKHERQVAIKVLKSQVAASLGKERFLREIGIAARLAHPHIVPLIDSGEAGGTLYYVSPFVTGGSLRDRLNRDCRLPVRDALRIVQEVGSALDYAHRSGFVHRDVKPENILFAEGLALLADFGVATVGDTCDPDRITESGVVVGTPEYMSPEQASGESTLEGTSDLYSLACVLYEMLAGEPPLRGPSYRATMAKQVTETPPPVRTRRPEVPPAVEEALEAALRKDPAQRFPTVAAFLQALQQPEAASAAPRIGLRSIAVLPFVNASPDPENEYLSDGLTEELINALAQIEGLRVASRTSVFALKGTTRDARAIGALLDVSEILEGTVRRSGDRLRIGVQLTSAADGRVLWSERFDRKLEDVFVIEDEIARTIVTTLRATSFADLAEPAPRRYTANLAAYSLYLKGRYAWNKRSNEGVTEAIACFEQTIAMDPGYALAYTGLADAYALHVDYRNVPVHEGFARAKEYARKALELDDSLAEGHASLAWSLFIYDWDWAAAGREFRRAIELAPTYATGHQWYAMLLNSQGRTDEALVEGHTALELDPASVSVRRTVGWLYYYGRRYTQARYHLARAIAMNPLAEESYRVMGLVLSQEGEHAEAVRVLREASAMADAGAYTRANLGYVLGRSGAQEEAEAVLREVRTLAERDYVSPVAFVLLHLGLGHPDEALHWAGRALEERRGWMAYLRVNPVVDALRGLPGFEQLLRKVRL